MLYERKFALVPIAFVDDAAKAVYEEYGVPAHATEGSAGVDLRATSGGVICPGRTEIVPTGVRVTCPAGTELQIRPRSGLAAKHGITVLNSPGTIDSDYRGEIKVILTNLSSGKFEYKAGERICQAVLAPYYQCQYIEDPDSLDATDRGEGGFGSSGTT